MDRRINFRHFGLLLLLGTLLGGCNQAENDDERDRLIIENARLTSQLERTHEQLRGVELRLRDLEDQQAEAEAAPTGPETASELLRTLAERDRELEQLRRDLGEAQALALRYRQAGERAVEELNRDRASTTQ